MDGFIDRLADFIKSLRGTDTPSAAGSGQQGTRYRDPDVQEAWEELDEFMRTGSNAPKEKPAGTDSSRSRPAAVNESLRPDYANLEVPFGSDIETVRASYKRLVLKYHPDRQGGDPELQKVALEIMKKINQSFERLRTAQS